MNARAITTFVGQGRAASSMDALDAGEPSGGELSMSLSAIVAESQGIALTPAQVAVVARRVHGIGPGMTRNFAHHYAAWRLGERDDEPDHERYRLTATRADQWRATVDAWLGEAMGDAP
jgi:hypothetical protein